MTHVKFNRKPFEGTFNTFVDDLFTELPVLFKNEFNNGERKGFIPVNVKETEKSYQLEVVAPGFEKTDFTVHLDQNLLTISAEKKEDVNTESEKQIRREYSFRSFKRSFTLDEKIDATNIEASYINGMLTLNLPKKETVKVSATKIVIK
jgi:HSP20 family protein